MEPQQPQHIPTIQAYIVGFALSMLLTLLAFGLTYIHITNDHEVISHELLHILLPLIALLQFIAQSIFFLHVSYRPEARANLVTYAFMIVMVVFIAGGSIWILQNLNRNMSPTDVAKYLHNEN